MPSWTLLQWIFRLSLTFYDRHLTMSCNEKVLKLNHWKVELDSTRHTHTHTYRVSIRHRRAPGLLNLVEFNLTKAEQVSLTDRHNFTYNWNCGTFKSVSSVCPPQCKSSLITCPAFYHYYVTHKYSMWMPSPYLVPSWLILLALYIFWHFVRWFGFIGRR